MMVIVTTTMMRTHRLQPRGHVPSMEEWERQERAMSPDSEWKVTRELRVKCTTHESHVTRIKHESHVTRITQRLACNWQHNLPARTTRANLPKHIQGGRGSRSLHMNGMRKRLCTHLTRATISINHSCIDGVEETVLHLRVYVCVCVCACVCMCVCVCNSSSPARRCTTQPQTPTLS